MGRELCGSSSCSRGYSPTHSDVYCSLWSSAGRGGRDQERRQLTAGGRRCARQAGGRQGLSSCCRRRRLQPAAGPDLLYICACMPAQACCHAGRLVRYPGRRPSGGAPAHTVAASSSGASSRSSGAVRGRLDPICAASARCLAWPMAAERHCRASASDGGFAGCGCHGKATVSYMDACERCKMLRSCKCCVPSRNLWCTVCATLLHRLRSLGPRGTAGNLLLNYLASRSDARTAAG